MYHAIIHGLLLLEISMKQKSYSAFLVAFLVFLLGVLMLACATPQKEKSGERVIQGMIRLYGNEPHLWTGIKTIPDEKIYYVEPPEMAKELRALQGRVIEFTVILEEGKMPLGGDGKATVISWRIIE